MRTRILLLVFILSVSLVPVGASAATTTIYKNTTLPAGEYFYDDLVIASSSMLTLGGNPSVSSFKGVTIHAQNITVESGSSISADGQGYGPYAGPGAPTYNRAGASYGGSGEENTATSTYGSALDPQELGSGSYFAGGGAIRLIVSGTLSNNGVITASGATTGSGGSINVVTQTLAGSGRFSARGGGLTGYPGYFVLPGGGGRIMVRYATTTFSGKLDVTSQCGYILYPYKECGNAGTAGLLDTSTNTLTLPVSWRFQSNDSPFTLSSVDVSGSALVEDGVSVTADTFTVENGGSLSIGQGVRFVIPSVVFAGGSQVTATQGKALGFVIDGSLTLASGSRVNLDGKGYGRYEGPGAPVAFSRAGASYGGVGWGNTATSTYGDANNPTDLGSGSRYPGGGALALTVSGTLTNDGDVSANGQWTGSGGSLLVRAHRIEGGGRFSADGGPLDTASYTQPGGGGRIALYSDTATSSFVGVVKADGSCSWSYGYRYCAGNGTVVFKSAVPQVSNVLFLPGIEASRLYRSGYNGGTDQLWEPSSDADAENLFLKSDGTSTSSDVYTKDVIDTAYAPIKGNIYKSFLDDLYSWKNTGHLIADYGVAPYDWRLSLEDILNYGRQFPDGRIYYSGDLAATSSPYLIQELRRLAKSSKTGKVTIVAHSNGGLVAKALTEKLGSEAAKLIDKIIFVAVPQVGTPKAIGAILHGYDQGLPLDSFPIALSDETARTFAKNMPSAYNLLPSANYFTYVDDPVVTFDNSDFLVPWRAKYGDVIHSAERLHTFIADQSRPLLPVSNDLYFPISGNDTLLSNAETLHAASLDAWTPPQGIALTEIAGWGEETPKTIAYYQGWKTSCSDLTASTCPYYTTVPALEYKVKDVLDGDGTVVVPSALWTATATTTGKWWVNLDDYNNKLPQSLLHFDRKHADILEVPTLRTLIQNILTNSTSTSPLAFISTSTPPNPDPETRLRFTLHSPLTLNLYDDLGNHTGFSTTTGLLEENIPGSRYQTYGELSYIEALASTTLRLMMNGYATGSFTLDIEKESGDITLASTTFAGIPSSTTTSATITIPQGGSIVDATPLLVDYDGNGVADFSLKPRMGKTSVFDITPPEAILTFDPMSQKLKIIGTDNLSSTTVRTTATSTIITDEADNTLQITFKKFKQEKHEIKLELQELRYNGIATTTEKTTLAYEWSAGKTGNIRELEEKATMGGLKIEGHYDAKKNVTRIEKKTKEKRDNDDEKETKEILPGLVISSLITDKGVVKIGY